MNRNKLYGLGIIILECILQGEQLGSTEATEVFFAMTKLFQSRDVVLRRMVYLGIKELASLAEDVIIVTSSLTKDMTGQEDLYRAAAIRALCSITDVLIQFLILNSLQIRPTARFIKLWLNNQSNLQFELYFSHFLVY